MLFEAMTFKKCSCCSKEWATPDEFKTSTTRVCYSDFIGGLALHNCECGTTLGIDALLVYPEMKDTLMDLWTNDLAYKAVLKIRKDMGM